MELITMQDYRELNKNEKEDYIKSILEINALEFFGQIKIVEGEKYGFLVNIYNSDTHDKVKPNYSMFKDENMNQIKVFVPNTMDFEEKDWVKFRLDIKENITINEIKKSELFDLSNLDSNIKIIKDDHFKEILFEKMFLYYENEHGPPFLKGNLKKATEDIFDELSSLISNKNKQLEDNRQKLNDEKKKYEDELNLLKKEIKVLEKYNWINTKSNIQKKQEKIKLLSTDSFSFNDLIEKIRQQLAIRGLSFDINLIRQVFVSLLSNELLVLVGPSGMGKTSLMYELSDIINAQFINIPVQPSWYEKQDLFGYYNPFSKTYISTPFIDALIQANENPEKLYIINLDEINLAKVEFYLAEILSIRELNNPCLELYSKNEYEKNLRELEYIKEVLGIDKLEMIELHKSGLFTIQENVDIISRYQNLKDFKYEIPIPQNVRIVGTMNVEGLVEPLSPKIIDRSFIVPVENRAEPFEITDNKKEFLSIDKSWWESIDISTINIDETFDKETLEMFTDIGLRISSRQEKHEKTFYAKVKQLNKNEQLDNSLKESIKDDLMLMKFLPKIHHITNDNNEEKLFNTLESKIDKERMSNSYRKYEKMINNSKDFNLVSFWS